MKSSDRAIYRLVQVLEGIAEWSGRLFAWLSLIIVLLTFVVVVLRYAFDIGWIAMQEAVTYMHAFLFLGGAAYTLKHQGHVRVDVFSRRYTERSRAWVDLFGSLLLLGPVCLFILFISWEYVGLSWELREGSREAGGLEAVYLLKSLILVMAVLLLIQGLVIVLRCRLLLAGVTRELYQDLSAKKTESGTE